MEGQKREETNATPEPSATPAPPSPTANPDIFVHGFNAPWFHATLDDVGVSTDISRAAAIYPETIRGTPRVRQFGEVSLEVMLGGEAEPERWKSTLTAIYGPPADTVNRGAQLCGESAEQVELMFKQDPNAVAFDPKKGRILIVSLAKRHRGTWLRMDYVTFEHERKRFAEGELRFFGSARCL